MNTRENLRLHTRIMLGLTLLCAVVLFFVPAIPQPLAYHQFADRRTLIGIPNFLDVVSGTLFLAAGLYGLKLLFDPRNGRQRALFEARQESIAYTQFFAASLLTCFGSGYYHLAPDNASLVWDRLPMTLMFASLLSIVISERISQRAGLILLPFLTLLGIFSVYHWHQTELAGAGDLRLYLLVQFFPAILILYMIFFLRPRYSRANRFGWIIAIYALAKVAEFFDREIFELQQWVSGHTIKHMLAAVAISVLAGMLRCRISINRVQNAKNELDRY
ncbi:MAG: hypothetical protein RQ867_00780 [Mariprofundaceae bacterium]|nr:hypothetical protein [Mariprofundaceae bacterium]